MAVTLTYADAYLASLVTEAREQRAFDDVDALGTFATAWRNKLAVIRAYIITCLESQSDPDDLFSAKLAAYRREWSDTLAQARAATTDDDGDPMRVLTMRFERG